MKTLAALALLTAPAMADTAPLTCMSHQAFIDRMAAEGAMITIAEVVQDGTDRRLEAYYQAKDCLWTLAIVQMRNGQFDSQSQTCLLGEGDPGVCIPKK